METENTQFNPELKLTSEATSYLKTSAGWAKFLAIVNFIGLGFLVLAGIYIFAASSVLFAYTPFPALYSGLGLFYIIMAVVIFFPTLYLFRFSQKAPLAVNLNDSEILEESLKNMKSYWKFNGIMTIILLAICILAIPIFIISAFAFASAF